MKYDFTGLNVVDTEWWWNSCWFLSEECNGPVVVNSVENKSFLVSTLSGDEYRVPHTDLDIIRPDLGWYQSSRYGPVYIEYTINNSYKKGLNIDDLTICSISKNMSKDYSKFKYDIFISVIDQVFGLKRLPSFNIHTIDSSVCISKDFAVIKIHPIEFGDITIDYALFYRLDPVGLVDIVNKQFIIESNCEYCIENLIEDIPNVSVTSASLAA